MALNLPDEPSRVTNVPFRSVGEDSAVVHFDGRMTDTVLKFHARGGRTGNLMGLTEIVWKPNDESRRHIHDLEDEGFFILDGALTVHTPHGDLTATKGQLAWGPRGVEHGYSVGPDGAQVLLFHTPGTRLSEYFEATANADLSQIADARVRLEYDQWAEKHYSIHFLDPSRQPEPETSAVQAEPEPVDSTALAAFVEPLAYAIHSRPLVSDGQDRLELGPRRWVFHVGGHQTGGAAGILEMTWGPDSVTPFLTHRLESQSYYVLAGALEVVLSDGRRLRANENEMLWVPRGVKHAYRAGPAGAHVLLGYFPGTRLDQMFRQTVALGDTSHIPDSARLRLAWMSETFGVDIDVKTAPPAAT